MLDYSHMLQEIFQHKEYDVLILMYFYSDIYGGGGGANLV